jgi:cysteine desulfurase
MSENDEIYLDYAAATPMSDAVLKAMQPYFQRRFYNPSATYNAAREVHESLESARTTLAFWLGCQKNELVFTAGGSEANNLAIHGVMEEHAGCNCVVSAVEHESILSPASRYDMKRLPVSGDGTVQLDNLVALIDDKTVLVSVMYANNEVGTIEPLVDVASVIESVRSARKAIGNSLPLYLHTDACQAANYLDMHVARLGVDMLTLNGGKLYGPKQSGALYIRRGIIIRPVIDGGGQERGLRSGTENVAGIIGLAVAFDESQKLRAEEAKRLQALQSQMIDGIESVLPTAVLNGPKHRRRLPNNVHFTFPGTDNERLIMKLDMEHVLAAAGSACSASDEEPSHVLKAMGKDDNEARSSLRLTMGRGTTSAQIDTVIRILAATAQG